MNGPSLVDIGIVDAAPEPDFDKITDFVSALTGAPVALVSIIEPEKDRQFFKSMRGLPEPWFSRQQSPLSHSFCKHVRATNQPLIVNNARVDDLVKDNGAVADLGVIAYLGVPIHGIDKEAIGALCAIDGQPRHWSSDDVQNLDKLASFVDAQIALRAALYRSDEVRHSLMLEVAARQQTEEALRVLAETDVLTGLANRRAFNQAAKSALARASIGGSPAILLVDIDFFKSVNDQYGHDAGDAVLKFVGRRMSQLVRARRDMVARYGGEEFAVLIDEADDIQSFVLAERLRLAVANAPFQLADGRQVSVTASFGLAIQSSPNETTDALLKRADKALYRAKSSGRNRVCTASDVGIRRERPT